MTASSAAAGSGVSGVIVPADLMSPDALVEYVQRLEALGYDSVWIPDMFGREIYVAAGHLLANTTSLRVGSGIAHIYGRDAIETAQAGATLTELSGGRFIHGLGVSHPPAAEIRGLQWENPVAKMRAYLAAMKASPIANPNRPSPPVYIAAHGPKMMQVAADAADGAYTYMQPSSHTAESRATLGPDKGLSVVLPVCMTTDPVAARTAGRRAISIYLPLPAYHRQWRRFGFDESDWSGEGSDRLVDASVAWGDEDAIRVRIAEHLDAGATQVQLGVNNPHGSGPPWDLLEALSPR
ncbi:MAG: TIGR03620 family F420-dependent LLM class oxidoreductase [Acidimicrobiia bacterium]|nr:TIGR03620 family F420-dependent LLM class oxidoreductase [Acidimicrobiia bacterium]